MEIIEVPPQEPPKRLTVYRHAPTLSEHKAAFLNLYNRNGFPTDEPIAENLLDALMILSEKIEWKVGDLRRLNKRIVVKSARRVGHGRIYSLMGIFLGYSSWPEMIQGDEGNNKIVVNKNYGKPYAEMKALLTAVSQTANPDRAGIKFYVRRVKKQVAYGGIAHMPFKAMVRRINKIVTDEERQGYKKLMETMATAVGVSDAKHDPSMVYAILPTPDELVYALVGTTLDQIDAVKHITPFVTIEVYPKSFTIKSFGEMQFSPANLKTLMRFAFNLSNNQ